MIRSRRLIYLIIFVFGLLQISCAHIPRESVLLSEELAVMINSAKVAHLAMLDEYMAEWCRKVDVFIEQKWIPTYLTKFVDSSGVLSDFEVAKTSEEKGQIMMEFTEACAKEIYKNRATLMDILDETENILKDKIQTHYTNMMTVNQTLTAHLRSAAKVTATREELLKQLKIEPEKILPLDEVNSSIEQIFIDLIHFTSILKKEKIYINDYIKEYIQDSDIDNLWDLFCFLLSDVIKIIIVQDSHHSKQKSIIIIVSFNKEAEGKTKLDIKDHEVYIPKEINDYLRPRKIDKPLGKKDEEVSNFIDERIDKYENANV